MSRFEELTRFFEYDHRENGTVEPHWRHEPVLKHFNEAVSTYRPRTIVKTGIGGGPLLHEMAKAVQGLIIVVEPSMKLIGKFLEQHAGDAVIDKVRFINGDFNFLPVDYYAADMIICVDMLDVLETGPVIDEFRRALQFDGFLFLAQTVLEPEDLEGVYDDMTREVHPLHTDYYLEVDLKTVLELNEFSFVKGDLSRFECDLLKRAGHLSGYYGTKTEDAAQAVERYKEGLEQIYGYRDGTVREPYFIGLFRRNKPE